MSNHKCAVYWAPEHDPNPALDHIRRLKPPVIRVMTKDVQHISDAHKASPSSIIIPRIWHIDDGDGHAVRMMNENPVRAAKIHVKDTVAYIDMWREQAMERGIPFPAKSQIIIGGANEPNQGARYPVICEYAKSFGIESKNQGYRATLLILGVGHPATPGEDWASWADFESLQPVLDAGGHWIETHGYWQAMGPFYQWTDETGKIRRDYPALAGRHHSCTLNAPHFVGECGVDGGIYNRNPRWGWQDYNITPEDFSQQLEDNHDALAPWVVAMAPFSWDYQDSVWEGFNVERVGELVLSWAATKDVEYDSGIIPAEKPYEVFLPHVSNDSPTASTFLPDVSNNNLAFGHFAEAVEFVLGWEGGYVHNPDDPGGETNFGISKNAHPEEDIVNMTRERAIEIYRSQYWDATGAGEMPWPFALMYFDTAVLHGPGAAIAWYGEHGADPYAFAWRRANVYMRSENWTFVDAWRRRTADVIGLAKNE